MEYFTLYEAWKREKWNVELQLLGKNFYAELSKYLKELKEQARLFDGNSIKARLLRNEKRKVEKLVVDLLQTRRRKILESLIEGKELAIDVLTSEEEIFYDKCSRSLRWFKDIQYDLLKDLQSQIDEEREEEDQKMMLVRFIQAIPAIVDSTMRTFGPFDVEDIASLPRENAKSLIKRGVAVKVEE
jgi:DNA replication initiation complex subunit (GINS family)